MKKLSPLSGIGWVPFKLRLRLARFALWRLKHGKAVRQTLSLVCLLLGSAGVGYVVAVQGYSQQAFAAPPAPVSPPLMPAMSVDNPDALTQRWVVAAELGKLQAEVVRLRVLFLRLADLAQLNDGEFDLDTEFEPALGDLDTGELNKGELDNKESRSDFGNGVSSWPARQLAHTQESATTDATTLVKEALVHMSHQAERMYSIFLERRMAFDSRVSGLPVVSGHVSSGYGFRVDPLSGRRQLHGGLDLVSYPGSEILAMADGIVTYSGRNGGYGNLVELEHPDGFRTRYAHNKQLLVSLGSRVRKGQAIATMGSTGRSTGTHVHVEVRHEGRTVDPQLYIR